MLKAYSDSVVNGFGGASVFVALNFLLTRHGSLTVTMEKNIQNHNVQNKSLCIMCVVSLNMIFKNDIRESLKINLNVLSHLVGVQLHRTLELCRGCTICE